MEWEEEHEKNWLRRTREEGERKIIGKRIIEGEAKKNDKKKRS